MCGDLVDGEIAFHQAAGSFPHPHLVQIGDGRLAGLLVKLAGEPGRADIQFRGQLLDGDVFGIVVFHLVDGAENQTAVAVVALLPNGLTIGPDHPHMFGVDFVDGLGAVDAFPAFPGEQVIHQGRDAGLRGSDADGGAVDGGRNTGNLHGLAEMFGVVHRSVQHLPGVDGGIGVPTADVIHEKPFFLVALVHQFGIEPAGMEIAGAFLFGMVQLQTPHIVERAPQAQGPGQAAGQVHQTGFGLYRADAPANQ